MKNVTREEAFGLWTETLRDPASRRDRTWLESPYDQNSRCSLGHLCHALGVYKETLNGRVFYRGQCQVLPDEVARLMNMTPEGFFRVPVLGLYHSMIRLNDDSRKTLAEIADVISDVKKRDNFVTY